jgi:hypothetical protein
MEGSWGVGLFILDTEGVLDMVPAKNLWRYFMGVPVFHGPDVHCPTPPFVLLTFQSFAECSNVRIIDREKIFHNIFT